MSLTLGMLISASKVPLSMAGTTQGAQAVNNVNVPVTIPQPVLAGDLIIVFLEHPNVVSATPPAGFTEIIDSSGGGNSAELYCCYKFATGGEGPTVTVVTNASAKPQWISYLVRGADPAAPPEAATVLLSSGTSNPDPPALTPSWGAANNLWIVLLSGANGNQTLSSYPTGYTDNQLSQSVSSADGSLSVATRFLNAASDNPGVFTLSGGSNWRVTTLAVKP